MIDDRNKELTEKIIGAAYQVANTLGVGFLEKVYENALGHELRKRGLRVECQRPIGVYYDGIEVGCYVADLVVEGIVIVELKNAQAIDDAHVAQCLNYLRATGMSVGLLLNFGIAKIGVRRILNTINSRNDFHG
ncbi:MAG: GxxExxY protein [Planctomycetaceae bacterium]|nr:GxxExxY protein [Planctomycetaceae bacterium]